MSAMLVFLSNLFTCPLLHFLLFSKINRERERERERERDEKIELLTSMKGKY
jgi:hypothetical protein